MNGMQNHVRFLMSRKTWAHVRMAKTIAAIIPPAMDGVYGQRTYSSFIVSDMGDMRSVLGS
jgi:hypothetical protein